MRFSVDYFAVGILLAGLLIFSILKIFFLTNHSFPFLRFSRLNELKFSTWRSRLFHFPKKLHLIALLCFMIAFIDPHLLFLKEPIKQKQNLPLRELPTQGIAIYLDLDQSGSMAEKVNATVNGVTKAVSKIDLLKNVTKQFILDHPSDLIGIVSFARVPRVLVPLTLDQDALLKQLDQLQVVTNPENDGTAMGYAIFKTANLMAATKYFAEELRKGGQPPYSIKSAVIIVVTDGFQDPNRLDQGNRMRTMELDDAAAYVKSQGIKLYVINVDPALGSQEYAPQRRQLQTITSETGGKFYLVNDNQSLQDIYATIDHLEKGTIMQEAKLQAINPKTDYYRYSLYPFFIALGLCCLFAALFLDMFILKAVP